MSERDPLDAGVTFGKYKGATWNQVLDRDPRYVQWAAENVDWLPSELREAMDEAAIEEMRDDDGWAENFGLFHD